jgi:ribosomal protein S6--L-glutamate ligase
MKIALLARNPKLYSHRRLVEAARGRGHEIEVIDTLRVYLAIGQKQAQIRFQGRVLDDFDAVIPRIGASITFYGTAVLRQFEVLGAYPLNESQAIARSRDKQRSFQLMARKGIDLPVTAFAHKTRQADDLIAMVNGPPVVIKLVEGTQGIGVVLAETLSSAKSMIEAFGSLNANILVQEFIAESKGEDIRSIVVGDRVVASILRRGAPGDFRSNLHRGGHAELIKISPAERKTVVKAAKALGLNVCGVDMLRASRGPVVLEVNSSPGLEGVEKATGKDIAGTIIAFLEKNARPHRTKTRGVG